jgi:hypothetical protein
MVFLKLFIFFILNYLFILYSLDIDFEQFKNDLNFLGFREVTNNMSILVVAFTVSISSLLLTRIFKPFMDLYILHYFKFSFYVAINFLSISSVYILFRIYGYSRLFLLLYLIFISFSQILFEKIEKHYS